MRDHNVRLTDHPSDIELAPQCTNHLRERFRVHPSSALCQRIQAFSQGACTDPWSYLSQRSPDQTMRRIRIRVIFSNQY